MGKKKDSSTDALRARLTPEQFHITQEKGTEPAFTGEFYNCMQDGTYQCTCCGAALFQSSKKYDSGSGWPSFTQPIEPVAIKAEQDTSHGVVREEIVCGECGAHLGHVFPDGPQPSGLRYCINSASLDLDED